MARQRNSQSKWAREAILTANHQLEMAYQQQQDPCIALMISRNYQLIHDHYQSIETTTWLEKARIWLRHYQYAKNDQRVGRFYDATGFFYDTI
jgi:hypothetical protein